MKRQQQNVHKTKQKSLPFFVFFFCFFSRVCLSCGRGKREKKRRHPTANSAIKTTTSISSTTTTTPPPTVAKVFFKFFFSCCFSFACAVWRSHVFAAPTATPAATRLPFDKCKEIPMRPFSTSSTVYFVCRLLLQCLAAAVSVSVSVAVAATATVTVTSTAIATATPADVNM